MDGCYRVCLHSDGCLSGMKRSDTRGQDEKEKGTAEWARLIHTAYRRYGYRLTEIADHLGVHPATISRLFKPAELTHV